MTNKQFTARYHYATGKGINQIAREMKEHPRIVKQLIGEFMHYEFSLVQPLKYKEGVKVKLL